MHVAANAADAKANMEHHFYSKATGKLRKSSHNAYSTKHHSKKDETSVYSLENDDEDYSQYPTGTLSSTQYKFIKIFIEAITSRQNVDIDSNVRGIHWIGCWKSSDKSITVSCSLIQPHITTVSVGLSGMSHSNAEMHARAHFSIDNLELPSIVKTTKYCQLMGKFAAPCADVLVNKGLISKQKTSWNMVVLSLTQPIFCVIYEDTAYECKLTHASCKVIAECLPESTTISFPTTGGHNVAFRSSLLRAGGGTGPSITVHAAGTIQYQGKPESIGIVTAAFKECIDVAMSSGNTMKFLRSLGIIRKISIG